MRSRFLVALQFALLAALLVPTGAWAFSGPSMLLLASGAALGVWALAANKPGNFNIRPDPKPGGALVVTGPYRYVRHPMYVAVLLGALGLALVQPSWWRFVALIALALVLHAKAAIEEAAMLELHPSYASYRARTARFVPFVW